VASLLAPLAVGGSVVLVRNPDPAKAAARAETEHVTVSH
jgi:non-ribosomal peptide synthetase component E (peptide arylation enzyme)